MTFQITRNGDGTTRVYSEETGKVFTAIHGPLLQREIVPAARIEFGNFVIGDLLWAKIGNHPFWPCMVSYDPIEGCYFKVKTVMNRKVSIFHVQYFGQKVEHGWTLPGLAFRFEGESRFFETKATFLRQATTDSIKKHINVKYNIAPVIQKAWQIAVREAEQAMLFNTNERYERFVFKYETGEKRSTSIIGNSCKRNRKKKAESSKSVKKLRKTSKFDEYLCCICEDGGIDFSCSGNCFHSYHKECLGLVCEPKDFKCLECEIGIFSCFICKKADGSVTKCTKCVYKYHSACLKKYPCANHVKNICPLHICLTCYNENPRNISTKGPYVQCFRCPTTFHATDYCIPVGSVKLTASLIICPDHFLGKNKNSTQPTCNVTYCLICSEGGELICCEACPSSFHRGCIDDKVPVGDFFCNDCLTRKFLYTGMILWAKTGHFRWWPAQIVSTSDLPINIKNLKKYDGEFPIQYFGTQEYFWAHRGRVIPYEEHHKTVINTNSRPCKLTSQYKLGLEEAAKAYDKYVSEKERQQPNKKPDSYKLIKVNIAVPPALYNVGHQLAPLRCICDINMSNPCGKDSLCLNRSVLMECHPASCPAGDKCENQRFQKRLYASVKVIKTDVRGWGLITKEFIPKDTFVIEYVGEILTHDEYRKRTTEMIEKNIRNYYFLYIDSRRMLDAGPKGNLSRFINHSCDPNCQMEKWSVNGDLKVGIFAIRDIQSGEELSFNYQSDSIQFKQKCLCGAANCQGIIGRNKDKQNGKKC